jgi:hypothetical protein
MGNIRKILRVSLAIISAVFVISVLYLATNPRKASPRTGKFSVRDDDLRKAIEPMSPGEQEQRIRANRMPEDGDGFRGLVHPLLHGKTNLQVTAHWSPPKTAPHKLEQNAPQMVDTVLLAEPEKLNQTYTERELSAFLPENFGSVGQVWAIAPRVAVILKQLHRSASLRLQAMGQQAGPDGAFGILRAISPGFLDIVCRIHCEFNLTPQASLRDALPPTLRYTPAYMLGRLIVNRQAGTVDYFRLGLPTDNPVNVHLTAIIPPYGDLHDIVRVDQLELEGGNRDLPDQIKWGDSIELSQAKSALAHRFYKFDDIAWVPIANALMAACDQKKPIFAVVSWGPIDDQSC